MELLDLDLDAVGDLLVVVEEDLLADDLVDEEALGFVGELVLIEERRALGQYLDDAGKERVEAEMFEGGDLEDLGLREGLVPEGGEVLEGLLGGEVDLVDNEENARAAVLHFLHKICVFVGRVLDVGDVEEDVGIDECGVGELAHLLLQFVVGFEYAGRVGIDDLPVGAVGGTVDDAHDAVARRLCFGRDDAESLSDEGVHEGGLPDVGVAYYVDESGFMHFGN